MRILKSYMGHHQLLVFRLFWTLATITDVRRPNVRTSNNTRLAHPTFKRIYRKRHNYSSKQKWEHKDLQFFISSTCTSRSTVTQDFSLSISVLLKILKTVVFIYCLFGPVARRKKSVFLHCWFLVILFSYFRIGLPHREDLPSHGRQDDRTQRIYITSPRVLQQLRKLQLVVIDIGVLLQIL